MRLRALCLSLLLPAAVLAQQAPAQFDKPQGIYAKIEVRETDAAIRRLGQLIPGPRREAIAYYTARTASLTPPALYALANAIAQDDQQVDTAVFWYHVGRIRAVYDALRCRDATAHNAVVVLGKGLTPEITRYQRQRRARTLEIAKLAVDWDQKNPRDYDHRWINLWGKVARTSAGTDPAELSFPESEWPAFLQRARDGHLKSVQEFAEVKR